ncbi:hypothetical protein L249_1731 [Ophiocordyceps polyrhachis-furcata BCC 54312]|uniref:Uncharacterized protein n=1 Tax=Ophiocordyceps polyrhachis-furcata BCC 54312 TaxID=1330021 RepID=A0A367LPY9_9HYPO|nr:hypothetical protein L249_1731 [Ophiocordyceps polyrhachis-furcata BCC 54312]
MILMEARLFGDVRQLHSLFLTLWLKVYGVLPLYDRLFLISSAEVVEITYLPVVNALAAPGWFNKGSLAG